MRTIQELRLMYPYFRKLGSTRRGAFVSALTWTPWVGVVNRMRRLHPGRL
jgi:hypothetical protein